MREARCLYPVKGHGGVKGKEYGTKEVRQARQKKGEICNKGQEVWEVGGRCRVAREHSTDGEEPSGTEVVRPGRLEVSFWRSRGV